MQFTSAVNLVVIRDNDSSSESVEDDDQGSNSEESSASQSDSDESNDIKMLVDLIEKATQQSQRKTPPVRTVRVVRRRPSASKALESNRKEKIQSSPNKEFHVHYHTHQHPKLPEEAVFEEDSLKPYLWGSLSSQLNADHYIYQKPKLPIMTMTAEERFKYFKDFETLLQSNKRPTFSADGNEEYHEHFDDTIVQHPPPQVQQSEKNKNHQLNLDRLRRYQALLNSRFRPQQKIHKVSKEHFHQDEDPFPNRDRFAGFTDFSTLENSEQPSRPQEIQKSPAKEVPHKENDDFEIKDFAIVIKTKPRTLPQPEQKDNYRKNVPYRNRSKHNVPQDNPRSRMPISVPRILDAPGGAPQVLEKINQPKYRLVDKQNLNSIESQQRQRFLIRPGFKPGPGNHVYNGWVIQRWLR